jgi:UDP-N-acetylmuramoyl-L-alanyl-D-glutamate--2,6-diaminopimelate ligase
VEDLHITEGVGDFLRLARAAGVDLGVSDTCAEHLAFTEVTSDSRRVTPGSVFVVVRGESVDGMSYVPAAIRAGARVVLSEEALTGASVDIGGGVACFRVSNARTALARLLAAKHGFGEGGPYAGMSMVGITGTNGKSTTAMLLRSILTSAGHRTALFGTIVYDLVGETAPATWTTPPPEALYPHLETAARYGATHAVMEVSSHALAQSRCDGVRFAVGVFTNLTGDHLDYHGSPQAYLGAKRRLFESLDARATAVVNADDPAFEAMVAGCRARVVRFGIAAKAEVRAEDVSLTISGSGFRMRIGSECHDVTLFLPGRHNVSNALAAASAAMAMGVSAEDVCRGLAAVGRVAGRLERVETGARGFSVFVDYAHTDDALENVLSTLAPLTAGRLICVFGCGGNRDGSKRPRMARVVARCCDVAIVTSDNPRHEDPMKIIEEIRGGFSASPLCAVTIEPDRRAAIGAALAMARSGDAVLIAGKGHEDYQIVGSETRWFDDVVVAGAWLRGEFARVEASR